MYWKARATKLTAHYTVSLLLESSLSIGNFLREVNHISSGCRSHKAACCIKIQAENPGPCEAEGFAISSGWETLSSSSLANITQNAFRLDVTIKHRLSKTSSPFSLRRNGGKTEGEEHLQLPSHVPLLFIPVISISSSWSCTNDWPIPAPRGSPNLPTGV